MTPEKQNRAIAEFCGYSDFKTSSNPDVDSILAKKNGKDVMVPNYCGDLNAIAEAKRKLNFLQQLKFAERQTNWIRDQETVMGFYETIFAIAAVPADKQAEDLLRTIGKWEDE